MIDEKKVEAAVRDLLVALGEDPARTGLLETPRRVAKMYTEILSGMDANPCEHLKFFEEPNCGSEIMVVKEIPVYSVCEHHLLPFIGTANIAYISKKEKIIGLSKFARIVDCFAKRLQVQERLTNQIAEFIYENIETDGVAVTMNAEHLCMTMRGVRAAGAKTQTAAFYGLFKEDAQKRAEVLHMLEKSF